MKKIYTLVFAMFVASSLTLTSCSEESTELTLKTTSTSIDGALSSVYEVVDKEYKVLQDQFDLSYLISVEIKKIGQSEFSISDTDPFGKASNNKIHHLGFGIEVKDQDGNIMMTREADGKSFYGPYSTEDVEKAIALNKGETAIVRWKIVDEKETGGKPNTFRITSAVEVGVASTNSITDNSNDWDLALTEYEGFVDNYIKLVKKAMNGDTSALTEYESCLKKAQTLQSKLEGAKGQMTNKQLSRFNKIIVKLSSAMN